MESNRIKVLRLNIWINLSSQSKLQLLPRFLLTPPKSTSSSLLKIHSNLNKDNKNTTTTKRKTLTSDSDHKTTHTTKKLNSKNNDSLANFAAFMVLMDQDLHSTDSGSDYQDSSGDSED